MALEEGAPTEPPPHAGRSALTLPLFFFNIRNGTGFTADEEGRDFADPDAARCEAVRGIRSMVSEEAKHGLIDLCGTIEVTDEAGGLVCSVGFAEAVEVKTRR